VINSLHIHHVRGLEETSLSLGPSLNLLVGDNGAGKTSVLEAVSILSVGRSFATPRLKSVIAFGQPSLTVFGHVSNESEIHRMAIQVSREDDRKLRLDGATARGQAALSRLLPVLQITPHVANLVSGTPGDRRRFLDWGAFHWSGGGTSIFSLLRRALLQRNTALRSGILNVESLKPWDKQISEYGEAIDGWRKAFLNSLTPLFESLCQHFELGVELKLSYKNGWGPGTLSAALKQSHHRDVKARATLVGPQRADFEIDRCGERAADTLSRGQLKIANLALVLSQLQAASRLGISPVLCLDDIGAELDGEFLSRVWHVIMESGVQVLATGISVDRTGLDSGWLRGANVFHVKHGIVETK
jgi:DNA replication and repair protein RecF